jgi:hypothetical protein
VTDKNVSIFASGELDQFLAEPEMQARMAASGLHLTDRDFSETQSDPSHDALWAMILEAHPEWRPEYEARKEEARLVWADPTLRLPSDDEATIPHDEVKRRLQAIID